MRRVRHLVLVSLLLLAKQSGAEQRIGSQWATDLLTRKRFPDVLRDLPAPIRQNLVVINQSASAQEATLLRPREPRIAHWDPTGRLFLSYNGHGLGQNSIEIMQYLDDQARFSFQNVTAQALTRDLRSCSACHGENQRPIWGEYPKWNAYGSVEDIMQTSESAAYLEFRQHAGESQVYQDLFPQDAWANYPYKPDADVRVDARSHAFFYRPNTRMSILLNRLNAHRITARLRSASDYSARRPQLAAMFLGCFSDAKAQSILQELGLQIRDLDIRYPYGDSRYTEMAFSDSYFDGVATFNELMAGQLLSELTQSDSTVASLYLPRSLRSMYHSESHKDLDAEFFAVVDRFGGWMRLPFPAAHQKSKKRAPPNPIEVKNTERLCQYFGQASDVQVQPALPGTDLDGHSLLKKNCASCHNPYYQDPNFDTGVREWLSASPAAKIDLAKYKMATCQMPRGAPCLTAKQQDAILDYLKIEGSR